MSVTSASGSGLPPEPESGAASAGGDRETVAGPQLDAPAPIAADRRTAFWRDLPGHTDVMVARLARIVGGPVGGHALIGRARFFTPLRVLLVLAVVFLALGWFGKANCIQQKTEDDRTVLNWDASRQYASMCYSDTVPLWDAEGLSGGHFPYRYSWTEESGQVRYMEYPVLSGLFQYVSAAGAHAWMALPWLPQALPVVVYFNVVAMFLALCWLVTVWASSQLTGRRVWDAGLIACSPLVAVHIFTNFDALATAFAALAMLAWARKWPVTAGILLGAGCAAKLYPIFLLGVLFVLCWRVNKIRPWLALLSTTAAAALTWLAVNLPIRLLYPQGWYEFFRLNSERGADPDSVYNVISSFTGWKGFDGPLRAGEQPAILNAVTLLLFVLVCAGVAFMALHAPRRPRVPQLAFLLVAGFLLTNKVWSPQYSLWLVPLAVLALPHRRILLAWMTIDALVWVPRMMYYLHLNDKNAGLPEQWFTATVVVRDIAVLALCGLVIYQIYRPSKDLVRYGFVDDPAGGIFDQSGNESWWRQRGSRRAGTTAAVAREPVPVA